MSSKIQVSGRAFENSFEQGLVELDQSGAQLNSKGHAESWQCSQGSRSQSPGQRSVPSIAFGSRPYAPRATRQRADTAPVLSEGDDMLPMSSRALARTWASPVGEDIDAKPKSCQAGERKKKAEAKLKQS